MKESPEVNESKIDNSPRTATDMELALFYVTHIDNPCSITLPSGEVANIRAFYLKTAKEVLGKMTNPGAIAFLEEKNGEYES